jgi:hypothetical protein
LAATAKTDSCGLSFELAHFGQDALLVPKTRVSKWWLHFSQMYSKIGIKKSLSYEQNISRLAPAVTNLACHLPSVVQPRGDAIDCRAQRVVQVFRVVALLFSAQEINLNQAHRIHVRIS